MAWMGWNEKAKPEVPRPDREPELGQAAERHRKVEEAHGARTSRWRRLLRRG